LPRFSGVLEHKFANQDMSAMLGMVRGSMRSASTAVNNVYNNTTVQRNITMDIDPHYQNSQSPADIRMDVSAALFAMRI